MASYSSENRRRTPRVSAILLCAALVAATMTARPAARAAAVGSVSGQVTNSSATPLQNVVIRFFSFDVEDFSPITATTDASGNYSANLPDGQYAVLTQNSAGYINEIYDNVPCSAVCDTNSITPINVSAGTPLTGINFALDPGGRIAGTITNSQTGLPVQGVRVWFIDPGGSVNFASGVSDASGNYISDGGTATGNVYALTENFVGLQNETWNNKPCLDCNPTEDGDPIAVTVGVTTTGIDFALAPGGRITGTVTNNVPAPLANVIVQVVDSNGNHVGAAMTDASGNYSTPGFPAGNYTAYATNPYGLVDEFYDNVPCPGGFCNPNVGTVIPLTVGATASNINFSLAPGGTISGVVTAAAGGAPLEDLQVSIYNTSGNFFSSAFTNAAGEFQTFALPPGTYYAAVINPPGFTSQVYDGLNCVGFCTVINGTAITVTANNDRGDVDFALVSGGSISGVVTNESTGLPVSGYSVQVLTSNGISVGNAATDSNGVYTLGGLSTGSYYVRTNSASNLINEVYNNVMCVGCNVTTSGGSLVSVTTGATTNNINFALTPGGRIGGTITDANTLAPLQNVTAQVFNSTGIQMGSTNTNASGVYSSFGLPAGTYYVRTMNQIGYVNELYDNISCPGGNCSVTTGTPVNVTVNTTTNGINFALAPGGTITGIVTSSATGLPIQGLNVQVFNSTGLGAGTVTTSNLGVYTTSGLPAGTYFVRTSNTLGFVDELYNNISCGSGCTVTSGTPIVVAVGETDSGINFALDSGGSIAGIVRDANTMNGLSSITVQILSSTGLFVKSTTTSGGGSYTVTGLPAGTYYARTAVTGSQFYLDELYNELPCTTGCTVTSGTPIAVTVSNTTNNINFTLAPGAGTITGTVTNRNTGLPAGNVSVQAWTGAGAFVKSVSTNNAGVYSLAGLPAGTYHVRTFAAASQQLYVDELYNNIPCFPGCNVTDGAGIAVVNNTTVGSIDFALAPNAVRNGHFNNSTTNWLLFATPDMSYISWQIVNGVFEYYRVPPPPGTGNQAVIFQQTGMALPANAPLVAYFSIGNTSPVRKRISVLVIDSDFSDIAVCTYWLAPNAPLSAYRMRTFTKKTWTNAAIYFYAATPGANGGAYQLDDVALEYDPNGTPGEVECIDPTAPDTTADPDGPEMLVNGDFNTGVLSPWGLFGQITSQITAGVFQFYRQAGTPAGVVLQRTGDAMATNDIMTATFQLGNSSGVRKRVTVLLHDNSFSDLSACTFWLAPGQPLSNYEMRTFATMPWTDATLSVYGATVGTEQWILLDNATFKKTPGTATSGTNCVELGVGPDATPTASPAAAVAPPARSGRDAEDAGRTEFVDASGFMAIGSADGPRTLQISEPVALHAGRMVFESWLSGSDGAAGEVQVSVDGAHWVTVARVARSAGWERVDVDLSDFHGEAIYVRFVVPGADAAEEPPVWRVRAVAAGRRP